MEGAEARVVFQDARNLMFAAIDRHAAFGCVTFVLTEVFTLL
jgi:hypothetical protein